MRTSSIINLLQFHLAADALHFHDVFPLDPRLRYPLLILLDHLLHGPLKLLLSQHLGLEVADEDIFAGLQELVLHRAHLRLP